MFHDFSEFFQNKDTSFINLNNGTLGLCPDVVIETQIKDLKDFEKNTSSGLGHAFEKMWNIQQRLGKFLGAQAQDIYMRPNVTLAINDLVMGLKLSESDEILTTDWEYGAVVNILKLKTRQSGASLRSINVDFLLQDLTPDEIAECFVKALNKNTKILVISHVFTGNGIVIPLKEISRAMKKSGVLLLVDGAHAPGLLDIQLDKDFSSLDFYTGNLHKWFMGPKGTAFGWVNRDAQHLINPVFGSWSTEPQPPYGMKEFAEASKFATDMLWSHSLAFSSFSALNTGFDFWEKFGKDFIFSEIKNRMLYLEDSLQNLGIYPVMSVRKNAAILAYKASLFPKAQYHGIQIKSTPVLQVGLPKLPGDQHMRLSPHIHNSQRELETAVSILSALV